MARANFKATASPFYRSQDLERLLALAPLFDVCLKTSADGTATICVRKDGAVQTYRVSASRAHLRVLAEVCEKVLPWVYFHEGEHCAKSLLKHSDERILRLAHLYQTKAELNEQGLSGFVTTLPSERRGTCLLCPGQG